MMDGAYPPGVEGWMLDSYFGEDDPEEPPRCCDNCEYFFNGSCTVAEADLTQEQIDAMSDEEYTELVSREPDDYCDEWKELI